MISHLPYRVLFACTGNSARSILAEFILRGRARGRFVAYSAGADPKGQVNPFVIEVLRKQFHVDPGLARSKSWREFEGQHFDFIITLCEKARETCISWPGHPITAHWSTPDPSAVEGSDDEKRRAVIEAGARIATRIGLFTALPDNELNALRIQAIGTTLPPYPT